MNDHRSKGRDIFKKKSKKQISSDDQLILNAFYKSTTRPLLILLIAYGNGTSTFETLTKTLLLLQYFTFNDSLRYSNETMSKLTNDFKVEDFHLYQTWLTVIKSDCELLRRYCMIQYVVKNGERQIQIALGKKKVITAFAFYACRFHVANRDINFHKLLLNYEQETFLLLLQFLHLEPGQTKSVSHLVSELPFAQSIAFKILSRFSQEKLITFKGRKVHEEKRYFLNGFSKHEKEVSYKGLNAKFPLDRFLLEYFKENESFLFEELPNNITSNDSNFNRLLVLEKDTILKQSQDFKHVYITEEQYLLLHSWIDNVQMNMVEVPLKHSYFSFLNDRAAVLFLLRHLLQHELFLSQVRIQQLKRIHKLPIDLLRKIFMQFDIEPVLTMQKIEDSCKVPRQMLFEIMNLLTQYGFTQISLSSKDWKFSVATYSILSPRFKHYDALDKLIHLSENIMEYNLLFFINMLIATEAFSNFSVFITRFNFLLIPFLSDFYKINDASLTNTLQILSLLSNIYKVLDEGGCIAENGDSIGKMIHPFEQSNDEVPNLFSKLHYVTDGQYFYAFNKSNIILLTKKQFLKYCNASLDAQGFKLAATNYIKVKSIKAFELPIGIDDFITHCIEQYLLELYYD